MLIALGIIIIIYAACQLFNPKASRLAKLFVASSAVAVFWLTVQMVTEVVR